MFARWPGEFIRPVWATGNRRREREVFTRGDEANVCRAHAIEWRESFGRVVCEVTARKHVSRVTSRNFRQFRIGRERRQSRSLSFLVYQIQHACFQIRTWPRLLDLERQLYAFI